MTETRIRSRFGSDRKSVNPETSHNDVNMTIPGETYSLRELVKKMKLGIMPPIERRAIWQDDADHSDLDLEKTNNLELMEKHEVIQDNKLRLNRLKQEAEDGEANRATADNVTEGSVADRRSGGEGAEEPLPDSAS